MKKLGFTLIELLIVIAVMAILATFVITNVVGTRERAKDAAKKKSLQELKSALNLYYSKYNHYPPAGNGFNFLACGYSGNEACGDDFTAGGTTYMNLLPLNDSGRYDFRYYACNGQDGFRIKIVLNNASDPELETSHTQCPASTCSGQSLSFGATDYVVCE